MLGLVVVYILFVVVGVCIIVGVSIYYGVDIWNVLDIVQCWDSLFVLFFVVLVILMIIIFINVIGNIILVGYQIVVIVLIKLIYKNGVLIVSIISLLICLWKLMENQDSIYFFFDIIGGMFGLVIGVMMVYYFVVMCG